MRCSVTVCLQAEDATKKCKDDFDATREGDMINRHARSRVSWQWMLNWSLSDCAMDKVAGLNSSAAKVRSRARHEVVAEGGGRFRVGCKSVISGSSEQRSYMQAICAAVNEMLYDNPSKAECDILATCKG